MVNRYAFAQAPGKMFIIHCAVKDFYDSSAAGQNIKIQNLRTGKYTRTNSKGMFAIHMSASDTLLLSSTAYYPATFLFTDTGSVETKTYVLRAIPWYYPLPEAVVISLKKLPENYHDVYKMKAPTIMNPVEQLYQQFSRRYKSYREYCALIERDKYKELERKRFEMNEVFNITCLHKDELAPFIDFCNFDENFVRTACDYDFLIAVKTRFGIYLQTTK